MGKSWLCEAVPGLVHMATTSHVLVTPKMCLEVPADW